MIPILYNPEETNFTTNGLGLLSDVLEAEVTEERNGVYQLHMVYPVDGIHFSEIQDMSVIRAVPADGKQAQPFDVFRISTPIDGKVEIDARHISYRLSKNTVMPFEATGVADAFVQIEENVVETCDFSFWTDKTSVGTMNLTTPQSVRAILGGIEGSVLDSFGGGEYEWDNFTVKLWASRGEDKGVTLRYGKNITDIKQECNIENTVTGIVPYWSGTDDEEGDVLVTLDEKAVYSANAGDFPYARTIPVDFSGDFQVQPTQEQLRGKAQTYIASNNVGQPSISIDISFIPLWQTEEYKNVANLERVNLCDTVTVEFPKLHISVKSKVVKTVYDVLKERYSSIGLGDARTNLASDLSQKVTQAVEGLKKEIPSTSQFRRILNEQTELITGGLGGYVKFIFNADGEPQELLFMDTDDIQTAVNVIRINKNGIGFSTNGYNPSSFRSAWTIDGKFSADFISTGHLLATLIKGGVLKMGGDNNGNGVIEVYDGNDVLVGRWDKDGLAASGDLQMIKNNINSGLGTAKYVEYLLVEGEARWLDKSGFYSKLLNNGDIVSSYAVFPESTKVTEQFFAKSTWQKTLCFAEEGLTKGMFYFLSGNRSGFKLRRYDYGDTSSDYLDGLLEFTINPTDGMVAEVGDASVEIADNVHIQGKYGSVFASENYAGVTGTNCELRANVDRYSANSGIYARGGERALLHVSGYPNNPGITIRSGVTTDSWGYAEFEVRPANGSDGGVAYTALGYLNDVRIGFSSNSSRRYKHNIKDLEDEALDPHKLLSLPVRQFEYNDDVPCQYNDMHRITIPGFIAEEVAEIYPSAVIHRDEDGAIESWDERRILPGMLALIQEQDKKIRQLEERLSRLERLLT